MPTDIALETSRTFLRQFAPSDAKFFYQLNLDPDVLLYTGDVPFASESEAKEFLEGYEQYTRFGMGRWAVIEKISGDFIGWCGLKYHEKEAVSDIGFRFFRKYWNQGYATETANACLEYGFTTLGLKQIIARVMQSNQGSVAVIKKLGMNFNRHVQEKELQWLEYVLTREEYLSNTDTKTANL